jgi:hypothetical protein
MLPSIEILVLHSYMHIQEFGVNNYQCMMLKPGCTFSSLRYLTT